MCRPSRIAAAWPQDQALRFVAATPLKAALLESPPTRLQSLEISRLIASRQRLVDLSAQTERLLESSLSRLERQRAIVQWLEHRGYPSDVARSLFVKMAEIVVTLQCQKAWVEKHLRESVYLELEGQPLPIDEVVPPNLAARVHQQFLLELASDTASIEAVANGAWLEMVVHRVMADH